MGNVTQFHKIVKFLKPEASTYARTRSAEAKIEVFLLKLGLDLKKTSPVSRLLHSSQLQNFLHLFLNQLILTPL